MGLDPLIARKRAMHAMSYDCLTVKGDPTEHERTRKLVVRHWSAAMQAHCDFIPHRVDGDLGYGTVLCHSEHGHEAFRSFFIEKAIKQTIEERYEKANH